MVFNMPGSGSWSLDFRRQWLSRNVSGTGCLSWQGLGGCCLKLRLYLQYYKLFRKTWQSECSAEGSQWGRRCSSV